jgi:hypothetical protein
MRRRSDLDCDDPKHSQIEQETIMGGDPSRVTVVPAEVTIHSGATVSRRLPVVCKDRCNGGWMSRLELAVIPILAPMIGGAPKELDASDQLILSRWADKTVMVMEMTSPPSLISRQADRARVMDESNPGPAEHTRVWIGHNVARPKNAELRGHKTFSRGLVTNEQGIRADVFTAGEVLFYVVSTNVDEWENLVPSAVSRLGGKLIKIWPSGGVVRWPPQDALSTDTEVSQLVDSLTEDGTRAVAQCTLPASLSDIARVWGSGVIRP